MCLSVCLNVSRLFVVPELGGKEQFKGLSLWVIILRTFVILDYVAVVSWEVSIG